MLLGHANFGNSQKGYSRSLKSLPQSHSNLEELDRQICENNLFGKTNIVLGSQWFDKQALRYPLFYSLSKPAIIQAKLLV